MEDSIGTGSVPLLGKSSSIGVKVRTMRGTGALRAIALGLVHASGVTGRALGTTALGLVTTLWACSFQKLLEIEVSFFWVGRLRSLQAA